MRVKRRVNRKQRFQNAIRDSLERLKASGETISKKIVIDGACFENGKQVGKTTLYSKHKITGEFVHAELLREVNAACDEQRKRSKGSTKSESMTGLRRQIRRLLEENQSLCDQVVEQEAMLKNLDNSSRGNVNILRTQETEIYVLARVANELSQQVISEFKCVVDKYEVKYRGDKRLPLANQEITRYLDEIKSSRLIGLNSAKSVK